MSGCRAATWQYDSVVAINDGCTEHIRRLGGVGESTPMKSSPERSPEAAHATVPATAYLVHLADLRLNASAAVDEEVQRLVEQVVGWGQIGRALGVSRQAARQRYGEHKDRAHGS